MSVQRPAGEVGNSVLQISTIFCSSRQSVLLSCGNVGTKFLIWKSPSVSELGGCARSRVKTGLRSQSLFIREITGNFRKFGPPKAHGRS
jgi:hypothetical protein